MSVINPNETAGTWRPSVKERSIELFLDSIEAGSVELAGAKAAGFPININVKPANEWIDPLSLEHC